MKIGNQKIFLKNIDGKQLDIRFYLILEFFAVILVTIVGLSGFILNISFSDLTANPISRLGVPFYQGILQRFGIIVWGLAVILPLFTFSILKSSETLKEVRKFLLFSGIFFGYFVLDELLLIHNHIFPKVLNIHQLLILIVYAILTLIFLVRFKNIIRHNFPMIFLSAVFFLGLSMMIDIVSYLKIIQFSYRYFLDDSFKFLGIFNLFIYYFVFCKRNLNNLIH